MEFKFKYPGYWWIGSLVTSRLSSQKVTIIIIMLVIRVHSRRQIPGNHCQSREAKGRRDFSDRLHIETKIRVWLVNYNNSPLLLPRLMCTQNIKHVHALSRVLEINILMISCPQNQNIPQTIPSPKLFNVCHRNSCFCFLNIIISHRW